MPEPIPPEHFSTLAYLWHQYEAQPLDPWQTRRDALLNRADRLEADYHAGAHRFGSGQAFAFLDRRLAEAAPHQNDTRTIGVKSCRSLKPSSWS